MKIGILDLKPSHPLIPYPPDWYPLYVNRQGIKKLNIGLKFYTQISPELLSSDTVFISSRYFAIQQKTHNEKQKIFDLLTKIKSSVGRLVWFDFRNSTGNTQFEVLPYVDKYLKSQLLKDRSLYQNKFYGNRIFTDAIHQQFDINDDYVEDCEPLPQEHAYKIGISWSPAITDYRGGTNASLMKNLLTDHLESISNTSHQITWHSPTSSRKTNMLALFNTSYERNTVAWQRKHVKQVIDSFPDKSKIIYRTPLSLKETIKARRNSKIILSLFGWGEICSREVQAWIAGAAVIMPTLEHLETWPNLHIAKQTYHPIKWDLSDLHQTYQLLLANHGYRIHLAQTGQQTYQQAWSTQARQDFCERIKNFATLDFTSSPTPKIVAKQRSNSPQPDQLPRQA